MTPREELELSIVDPDIAKVFMEMGSGRYAPGAPIQMQLARSLKEIIPLLHELKKQPVTRN